MRGGAGGSPRAEMTVTVGSAQAERLSGVFCFTAKWKKEEDDAGE